MLNDTTTSGPGGTPSPGGAARSSVTSADTATRVAEVLLPLLALLNLACWVPLYRWYALSDKYEIPYFAFEKIPGYFDSPVLRRTLWLFLASVAIYAVGLVLIARARRLSVPIKLAAIGMVAGPAVVNVLLYPVGALDVFNYMVDLKMAYHYDANPYVETMPEYIMQDPVTKSAFLLHVPLFYGPAWLLLSALPAFVVGFDDILQLLYALKIFNLLLLVLTAALIYHGQRSERRGWLAAYAFLANPLILFEGVGNAHNDVLMTLFLVGALVMLKQERAGWLAGPLLALSILVKLFTVTLGPLFLLTAWLGRWGRRQFALAAVATVIVTAAVAAPFWDGGDMADGLREGTRLGQEMDHVSLLSLAQQQEKQEIVEGSPEGQMWQQYASSDVVPEERRTALRWRFGIAFALLALAVVAARARGLIGTERATAITMMLFSLLLTNLYGWYLIPIFAALALSLDALGAAYLIVGSALALTYYPMYVWVHFQSGWQKYDAHLFLALFLTAPMVAMLLIEGGRLMVRLLGRATVPAAVKQRLGDRTWQPAASSRQ